MQGRIGLITTAEEETRDDRDCECTDNARKDKYVCTIFSVLITLCVNSQLNYFHYLIVFKIILFLNTQGILLKENSS